MRTFCLQTLATQLPLKISFFPLFTASLLSLSNLFTPFPSSLPCAIRGNCDKWATSGNTFTMCVRFRLINKQMCAPDSGRDFSSCSSTLLSPLFFATTFRSVNIHLVPDLTMKNLIIAFWCNFILTGIVDSTTNAPACDLVSSDNSKCYFYRTRALTFGDSIAFCRDELQAELPSNFDPEDESGIAEDLGLFFWIAATFRLHHDQNKNRIQLLNPQHNFTEMRWDFTAINLTIFWSNESYCAEAVPAEYPAPGGSSIVWAPKDCNQLSGSVLCERSLTPHTTTTISLSPTSGGDHLFNNTFSDGLVEEVFDSQIDTRSRESDIGLLDAAILIFTRGSYYMERLRRELIASLMAGVVILIVLLTGRIAIRRLRRSSSSYFTVEGTALVYVKTDLPQAEIPRNNKCTSFIIRGCE